MTNFTPAISQRALIKKSSAPIEYLTSEEIYRIAEAAEGRHAERNSLFIITLYQTGLRISEAISITPEKIIKYGNGFALHIVGKGKKLRNVACPTQLINSIMAYAYSKGIKKDEQIFPFTRNMGWMIIKNMTNKAGIEKRVFPHLFRHSDAIERLKQTMNPKALQLHLGHSSIVMTMRYLNTLTQEEAVKTMQEVQF